MTAIEEAIQWMDLDKRCCGPRGHCLKCDGILQRKFDAADSDTRRRLADAVCSCSVEDLAKNGPLLWLVALLDTFEYERFVAGLAKLVPYDRELAWQIIRLSAHNKGNRCFALSTSRRSQFRPRFHLHPAIAPALLAATVRPGLQTEDAIELCDLFEPVADRYPALRGALPLWRTKLALREGQAREEWLRRQEAERLELVHRASELEARGLEFRAVEARGPLAVLSAILEAPALGGKSCADRWAKTPEKDLATMPSELLGQIIERISTQPSSRCWNGLRSRIQHVLRSRAHSAERRAWLDRLGQYPLRDRLRIACDSRWSLTYFPEGWAGELLRGTSPLPADLRSRMLSKVSRLSRRSRWRDVRQALQAGSWKE